MVYPLGSRWVSMWAMKKGSGCLGYIGDEQLPSYVGIIWNDERRIPIKQHQDDSCPRNLQQDPLNGPLNPSI